MRIATGLIFALCALEMLAIMHCQRKLDVMRAAGTDAATLSLPGSRPPPARSPSTPSAESRSQPTAAIPPAPGKTPADGKSTAAFVREKAGQLSRQIARGRLLEAANRAYGPFVRRLHLDPDTAAHFEAVVVEEQMTAGEAIRAEKAQGVIAGDAYLAAVREAVGELDRQLEYALGPANFAAFSDYRQTLPEEGTVNQLSEQAATAGAPLTDGQQAQLVVLLNQMESPDYRKNEDFLGMIGVQQAPLTESMVDAAGQILSPSQVQALQAMQANIEARAAITKLLQSGNQ